MDGQHGGGTPSQYSADGKWWWDGRQWVAAEHAQPAVTAAPAKARMPHQRRSFWIGLGVITLLLVGTATCMSAAANAPRTQPGGSGAAVTSTQTAAPTATPTASASATPTPTPTPTVAPTATPTAPPAPTAAPPVAAAPPPTAAPAGCYPLSNSGTCYEPGEFCRTSDHGRTGRAGNGEAIICEYNNGWRWEPV